MYSTPVFSHFRSFFWHLPYNVVVFQLVLSEKRRAEKSSALVCVEALRRKLTSTVNYDFSEIISELERNLKIAYMLIKTYHF